MPLFNSFPIARRRPAKSSRVERILATAFCLLTVLISATAVGSLTGCSKVDEMEKRKTLLNDFCTKVAQHLFDHNPETMEGSLNMLLHEELTDKVREKLEDIKVLPDSPITILKEKEEAQKSHLSNKIDVIIVKPLTAVSKNPVAYKVGGKETILFNGKPKNEQMFSFTMVCDLTPEMGDYPRVVDIAGLQAPAVGGAAPARVQVVRRRRHR